MIRVVGVLVTIVAFGVGAIYAAHQKRKEQNRLRERPYQNESRPISPEQRRNLTCALCGSETNERDCHALRCGHICHISCQRLRKRNCLFCDEPTKCNDPRNDKATETALEMGSKCAICDLPLDSSEKSQIKCRHWIHSGCRRLQNFFKCNQCISPEDGTNTNEIVDVKVKQC